MYLHFENDTANKYRQNVFRQSFIFIFLYLYWEGTNIKKS